jgi:hypothetical protein
MFELKMRDDGTPDPVSYYNLKALRDTIAAAVDRRLKPFFKSLYAGIAVQLASRQARRGQRRHQPATVTKGYDTACACEVICVNGVCRCK